MRSVRTPAHRRRVDHRPSPALPLADAEGLVLAADVILLAAGFDNSAMDGYAVRWDRRAGAGPTIR